MKYIKNKKHTIKAISLLWMGSIVGAGCTFLINMILARQLGPTEFGVFSSALSTVTLVTLIAGFGTSQYWLKVFGKEGWGGVRWLPASFIFVGISILFAFIILIAWSLFGPHNKIMRFMLMVLSIYVFGQVTIELVSTKLQLEERYSWLALWQLLPNLSRFILVVILAYWLNEQLNVRSVAYIYASIGAIFALIGFFQLFNMAKGNFYLKGHVINTIDNTIIPTLKDVISQTWPFGLAILFSFIYIQSDIILVKYITGDAAAGIYNVAFVILVAVLLLPSVLYQKFLIPKIHRWANHDVERFYQVYRQGNLIMLIIGILAMVAIWLLADWMILFLFGKPYRNAVPLIYMLSLTVPILFVAYSVAATLVTQEHMKIKVKLMGIVAVINILLNILLIPKLGAMGAAISTVISNLLLLGLYFFAAEKYVFIDMEKSHG
jgi:O-antigen/teichoic acid export membrane protein